MSQYLKLTLYSNQVVLLHDQKVKTKVSWEREELLRWNKKRFFIIFKGFSIAKNCLRPDSASLTYISLLWTCSKEFYIQVRKFIKMRLKHRCFHVRIAKYLRTAFLWNIFGGCFCRCNTVYRNSKSQHGVFLLISSILDNSFPRSSRRE